jgi:diketogulonate reductase-like aldo/keto reductase
MDLGSTVEIAPDVHMPRLGLGTYKAPEGGGVEAAVSEALEIGYRAVDTASVYGNERGIGRAIAGSGMPREDVFVTTKVWNDEQGYESTLDALDRSLERLGTDYVDLYLVHWPHSRLMADTWRAMQEALGRGKTRAIGVSNHLEHHLAELAEVSDVDPAVNQFEFHPRLQQPSLVAYCRARGIIVEAWSPIMRGDVLQVPELVEIGDRHGKTAVQVTLRWILQEGHVTIPKTVHVERLRENAAVFDFELSPEEMDTIRALDTGQRRGAHPDGYAEQDRP